MAPLLRIADPEIDATAPLLAAEVLAHPFALQLSPATLDALVAIASEESQVRPEDARRVLHLALVAIDAAEIALGMEART